jgi:fatty-acyl-CoA synthase
MGTIIYLDHEGHNIRPGSFGKPNIFCDVQIMKDNGEQARLGEIGEIVVRCPSLMLAYYKNPKATKEFFRYGSDWGCTGDLGFMDEESFITLSCRKKDMYISGGRMSIPWKLKVSYDNILLFSRQLFWVSRQEMG